MIVKRVYSVYGNTYRKHNTTQPLTDAVRKIYADARKFRQTLADDRSLTAELSNGGGGCCHGMR